MLVAVLMMAAIAGPATAQTTTPSAPISGMIGDPTIDQDATFPGAYLRYTGDPAPAGFTHDYQWAEPLIRTVSPEDQPVVIDGTLDLTDRIPGSTGLLGLLDYTGLQSGDTGYQTGAYVYISIQEDGVAIYGPSDGNDGGEVIQRFITNANVLDILQFTFTVDGQADPASCASDPADAPSSEGCMVLEIDGMTLTDSYGTYTTPGEPNEFAMGAIPGWDSFTEDGNFGHRHRLRRHRQPGRATAGQQRPADQGRLQERRLRRLRLPQPGSVHPVRPDRPGQPLRL